MNRLLPIEGLRAYLAIWVVINHVIFFSVARLDSDNNFNPGISLIRMLMHGRQAVDVFMIVSGFVIFLLLDKKKEPYPQFILRRFFRLYPLYIILLFIAIATGPLDRWTFEHSQHYMNQGSVDYYSGIVNSTSNHFDWNVFWHVTMLHGIVPNHWLGGASSYAFIISAWSVSVEWQFYLLAPLVYMLVREAHPILRMFVCAVAFLLYVCVNHNNHFVAVLPLFVPFFCIGIVSYFTYKILHSSPPDTAFPIALGLAVSIFLMSGRNVGLISVLIWIPFLGLLCEDPASISSTLFLRFFNHKWIQFLGAISYGIYLCHEFTLMCAQYLLIVFAPELGGTAHFVALLFLTLSGTIVFAAILHRFVEVPGIDLGKKLAKRLARHP